MADNDSGLQPRVPRGFRDIFAEEVRGRHRMMERIRQVYERYGFEPLDTPALEYLEVLGKYLPEADLPDQGVFAFRDEGNWVSLRYDLTAPLSRVFAQYAADLPKPYRRYQMGPVWRREKAGPGRFREFYQVDFDTVGTTSMGADAEACAVLADAMEALGIGRGDYVVRVNNRKVLNGVLETLGIPEGTVVEVAAGPKPDAARVKVDQRLAILRSMDKLDRLGFDGVRELLLTGRLDESGDYAPGAGLTSDQAESVIRFMQAGGSDRGETCDRLLECVAESAIGQEGVEEMREIGVVFDALDMGSDRVRFDPSVVRGLAYYTGPVYEVDLKLEIRNRAGELQRFGSVAGGGRYDDLVERFTGQKVPATGASIGVDRLYAALRQLEGAGASERPGPVVVTVMDPAEMPEYQRLAATLRAEGIAAEVFLGKGRIGVQLRYADRRGAPAAVIAGEDELGAGDVSVKDLRLGQMLAKDVEGRETWRKERPGQVRIPRSELVSKVREIIEAEY